jgi:glyoxylase-like metal-dependent hydrolase (beta-lactamase superfamily II)
MKSFAKLRSSLVLRSLFTVFAGLSGCAGAEDRAQENNLTYEESLKVDSYASDAEGFDTRSFWIDTGLEVVVFDAQFTERHARELLDAIRAKTSSPIRFVVVTHPNPDKFNGSAVFRAVGAKVVASERTAAAIPGVHAYKRAFFVDVAKMIPADQYPAEPIIDLTFRDELKLPTNAGEIWLRELDHAGVSSTQTVGWVPAARALFVGDLVHHGVHAWLEGGIVDGAPKPDLAEWSCALGELSEFDDATVYGGRGDSVPLAKAVAEQQAYLAKAGEIVREYVNELGTSTSELSGPDAGKHHAAIAKRFEAEWPSRGLSYLVQYGVYGLVNSVAKP